MNELREIIKGLLGLKKLPDGEGLEGFTDEQLKEAETLARTSFAEARESKDAAAATAAHSVITTVTADLAARADAAAALDEELNKLAAEIEVSDPEPEPEPAPEPEPEPEIEPEVVTPPVAEVVPEPEPVAVAASVTPAPKPRAVPAPSKPPVAEVGFSIQAGADLDGHSAGSSLTPSELGEAFASKAQAMKGGRVGGRTTVAKIKLRYPSEYVIDSGSLPVEETQRRIEEVVTSLRADASKRLSDIMSAGRDTAQVAELTAAGGFCAPFTPRYDICQQGDDVRPLRDSLPTFNATRGGIIYLTPPQLSDVAGSVNVYTEEQDATGYDYPKGCIRVDCGDPIEEKVQAVTLCMEVGNFQRLSFPENFRAWWHYGHVAFARTAEVELWDKMIALATDTAAMGGGATTANASGTGAARNTLNEIERYIMQMRYSLRSTDPMHLWLPEWVKAVLRADLTQAMPGDSTINVSDATLTSYMASRGVNLTFLLDGQSPGAFASTDEFPDSFIGVLALEGTFLRLDMGSLDFGTEIRDFTQIRQNDVGAFMEIFEGLAAVCRGAQAITFPICPSGKAAISDVDITC